MGQAKFDSKSKSISVPKWLFMSKSIPLSQVKGKTEQVDMSTGNRVYRLTLTGDFGEQEISFNDYESYVTFVYEYQKAIMGI